MHPQIISKWIDKKMLLNENISGEILSWLLEEESITQRIMKDYSFSLELISSKEEIISCEEKTFLEILKIKFKYVELNYLLMIKKL